jgi:ADP-heptose:LPS heptosyltransferase
MFKPAEYKPKHRVRILVDRRMALGDVIMITPVLRELRKRYPDAWLQVVTSKPEALANNPHVDLVVQPDQMQKSDPWDVYVNLNDAYENNVTCHYVDSMLNRTFGSSADTVDRSLEVYSSTEEQEAVADAIKEFSDGQDYIVVHMRRWAWENKNVDIEIWTAFLTRLEEKYPDLKVVSVGADYDYSLSPANKQWVNLNQQLTVGEIRQLISNARAFVGTDSGPYHIACSTDTPIVLLSSHLAPEQILPWRDGDFGKNCKVVKSHVPCLGCYARQQTPVRNLTCENEVQWACAKKFDNLEMFTALSDILETHQ